MAWRVASVSYSTASLPSCHELSADAHAQVARINAEPVVVGKYSVQRPRDSLSSVARGVPGRDQQTI